jgi:sulfite exporter TauE/SafE
MLAAFLLGLVGSLGHCVGMCSAVMLLVARNGAVSGWRMLIVHLGRVSAYAILGGLAGALAYGGGVGLPSMGHAHGAGSAGEAVLPGLRVAQGFLALAVAAMAVYLALALVGRAPSPEIVLARLSRRWGGAMRRLSSRAGRGTLALYLTGLLWGLLPCGLVLTALLTAMAAGSPWRGALAMLAFGLGTCPALLGVGVLAWRRPERPRLWPRHVAALVVLIFGAQTALRGLTAWGWVEHLFIGGLMVW